MDMLYLREKFSGDPPAEDKNFAFFRSICMSGLVLNEDIG